MTKRHYLNLFFGFAAAITFSEVANADSFSLRDHLRRGTLRELSEAVRELSTEVRYSSMSYSAKDATADFEDSVERYIDCRQVRSTSCQRNRELAIRDWDTAEHYLRGARFSYPSVYRVYLRTAEVVNDVLLDRRDGRDPRPLPPPGGSSCQNYGQTLNWQMYCPAGRMCTDGNNPYGNTPIRISCGNGCNNSVYRIHNQGSLSCNPYRVGSTGWDANCHNYYGSDYSGATFSVTCY